MSKVVVLSLGNGDLNNGFPSVTVDLLQSDEPHMRFRGSLPAGSDVLDIYTRWQFLYKGLYQRSLWMTRQDNEDDFEIYEADITNVTYADFGEICQKLEISVNQLLNSESFRNIDQQLRTQLKPDEEIQVIIESDGDLIQRLPWHLWNFFKDYPKAEIALSPMEYKRVWQTQPKTPRDKVKILAIFGNPESRDSLGNVVEIEIAKDLALLQQLPDAEVKVLVEPNFQELNKELWESCWDILFFAGHSSSQEKGRIKLNRSDYLSIDQLSHGLRKAIEQGLQLAIFNSCDSLGLARDLASLNIPQVIVMREPVPDKVAQDFLKHFLRSYSGGQSLSTAVREARERLQELENDFHCATWLPVICPNPAATSPTWQDLGRWTKQLCPYRGLFAFREEDSRFFFGRETFTQQLFEAVQTEPLVTVIGPSGSGKSSVVYAGLIPLLRSQENWCIVSFRPGDRPFHALASELILYLEPHLQNNNDRLRETRKLAEDLRRETGALRDTVEAIARNMETRFLLVADQFEELYTLCETEERKSFLERLLEVVNIVDRHTPYFSLVLTLRADFLDRALSEHSFADFMRYGHQMLGPMNREELKEVIIQPATRLGVTIEEGLTKRLLDDVNAELGRLPLLEFALTQLWHKQSNAKLTNAAYDEIGGVQEALALYAEEMYNKLNEEEKERARRIFIQLVQPGEGTPDTRRLATRKEIGEENWDLITHLATVRLVITNTHLIIDRDRKLVEEETVEIVHEALIGGWFRLQTWVDLDRDFRIWQERLRNSMRLWERSQGDEGALLRGLPLAEAEAWMQERLLEVSVSGRLFIKHSIELRDREAKERDRRRRFTIIGLSIALLVVSIFAGFAIWFRQKAEDSLEDQINALSRSSQALRNANQEFDALLTAMRAGHPLWTQQIQAKPETLKQVLEALQRGIFQVKERNRLEGHKDEVWGVNFNSDGKLIATASFDKTVKLWTHQGQLLKILTGHTDGVTNIAVSPDDRIIATTSFDETVKLWDPQGKLLKTLEGHNDWVYGVSFSPDGQTIATASKDKTVKLWNLKGQQLRTFSVPNPESNSDGGFNSVTFSPDGKTLAAASWDRTARFWNLSDGKLALTIKGSTQDCTAIVKFDETPHCDEVNSVSFSPDGKTIATASSDKTVKLWDRSGKLLKTLTGHTDEVNSVIFSPDGETIASVSSDKTIKLWSRSGEELKPPLTGHNAPINSVVFSPDGRSIATASFDRTVKLWNYSPHKRRTLVGHQDNVWGVTFSPDGQTIATASQDKTVKLWSRDGKELRSLTGHKDIVTSVNFSPDGKTIATTSKDKTIKLWNREGQEIKTLTGHKDLVDSLSFSHQGDIFATGSWDGEVRLWRRNGELLRTFQAHIDRVYDISFSPDGQKIATVSRDRTVKLWNRDGARLQKITGHPSQVYSVSFSPDGKILATASRDGTAKLWNQNDELLQTLSGHASQVYSVKFSPDGLLIATTSRDKTVKIWNQNGELLQTLSGHAEEVDNVSFSPDSKTIATASRDDTVILWNLDVEQLEKTADLWSLKIDDLMERSCDWARDYLTYNSNVTDSDKHLCDRSKTQSN